MFFTFGKFGAMAPKLKDERLRVMREDIGLLRHGDDGLIFDFTSF
jgi:hypothetical protein